MAKIRYRVQIFFDVFVEKDSPNFEKHMARHEALKIIRNIPNFVSVEVKRLPYGSEEHGISNLERKSNENNQD